MIAISGGVISKEIGTSVSYKLKCEKCEHEDQAETTVTVLRGITEITTKKCPNCGNNQVIKMKQCLN